MHTCRLCDLVGGVVGHARTCVRGPALRGVLGTRPGFLWEGGTWKDLGCSQDSPSGPSSKDEGKSPWRDYDFPQNSCCGLDSVAAVSHCSDTRGPPGFSQCCFSTTGTRPSLALVSEPRAPCLSAQGTREEDDVVSEDLVQQDAQVNKP